jgi:putative flippase GtrA
MPALARPPTVPLLARGASVGLAATLVDLSLLALLYDAARLPLRVASPAALLAGVAVQFVGSRAITFRARGARWLPQALGFAAVELLSFAANVALTELAASALRLPPTVVRVPVTSLVYFGLSLPLWSRVFRPEEGVS